jgi:hypothetical protein
MHSQSVRDSAESINKLGNVGLSDKQSKKKTKKRLNPSAIRTPRWQIIAAFAAVLIVYIAMRLPGIGVPLERDEGTFGYMGQLINQGKLPYRDGVDHKPPVAFYINALALHFVPHTEKGIHVFLLLYNFLTLVCIFYIGKTYFRSLSAGIWSAFVYAVFSANPTIEGFSASTEMWMLLPIVLSLLLSILGSRRNSPILFFMSGVAGAMACWTKQSAFTSILFVFVFTGIAIFCGAAGPTEKPRSALIRSLASWLSGAVLFSAAIMLYFYFHGIFREFIYWSFQHNLAYSNKLPIQESISMGIDRLIPIVRDNFAIFGAGLIAVAYSFARKKSDAYFILGFIVLSFLGTVPGFAYSHYFVQLAPAVALAGGIGISILVNIYRTAGGRLATSILCGFLIIAISVGMYSEYFLERNPNQISRLFFGYNPFPESKLLAEYIAKSTTPADPVFIVGSEPQILFYSERSSPSSFLTFYPLMASYERYREFQDKLWNEVHRTPPKYILYMVKVPTSFAWDRQADVQIMERIDKWLSTEYTMERVMLVTDLQGEWTNQEDSRLKTGIASVCIFRRKG